VRSARSGAYARRVRRLLTPRWLAWHLLALLAVGGCLGLGWWQFQRASGGNRLSWAYTFEWPVFAGFVVLIWANAVRDEMRRAAGNPTPSTTPPPLIRPSPPVPRARSAEPAAAGAEDPELAAYNRYLAWLTANPDRRPNEYPG